MPTQVIAPSTGMKLPVSWRSASFQIAAPMMVPTPTHYYRTIGATMIDTAIWSAAGGRHDTKRTSKAQRNTVHGN